jgi:hypothetical protein
VDKYRDAAAYRASEPYDVVEIHGNALTYGGASVLWHRLTGGSSVAAYSNALAHLGVGDSSTAAAAGQTDLQGSNKLRKAMDTSYPAHTDGTTSGAASVQFKSTFGPSDANFAWLEWGIFNASGAGRMLNRKAENLGTKTSGTWVLTVTLTLA